ncbi:MAG: T9SS type A sorting domain-containing protein [Candidatus Kapabacteria bacterium]|nr:T9SS type A sorting domain-containing protein [Candidatus Kapabacteria bacterium]
MIKRDNIQKIDIIDMNNSIVRSLSLIEILEGEKFEIDISKLTNGLYVLQLQFQNQVFSKQLLIHR